MLKPDGKSKRAACFALDSLGTQLELRAAKSNKDGESQVHGYSSPVRSIHTRRRSLAWRRFGSGHNPCPQVLERLACGREI